jgi:hypothetical protein
LAVTLNDTAFDAAAAAAADDGDDDGDDYDDNNPQADNDASACWL